MADSVLPFLPAALRGIIERLPKDVYDLLEEIRVREGRPLEIIYGGQSTFVTSLGKAAQYPREAYAPSRDDCEKMLDLLANHSMYTLEEQLKKGFITLRGGHRVGLAGKTLVEQGKVKLMKEIGSFNIRLAREHPGVGKQLLPLLADESAHNVYHTLIISPPQQGKTTMIRDLARLISGGMWQRKAYEPGWRGLKVGIVDERSEVAACVKGVPRFDVGPRTDVLDCCPKAEGMMMMIRSMSPDVIIVDEIGRQEDADAIHEAIHAGIRVIATAHGKTMKDVNERPAIAGLHAAKVFSRYVFLDRERGMGVNWSVFDGSGKRLDSPASLRTLRS